MLLQIKFLLVWLVASLTQIKQLMKRLKDINHLAALMSQEMNEQHRQGITLDGEAGENMFLK